MRCPHFAAERQREGGALFLSSLLRAYLPLSLRGSVATEAISCPDSVEIAAPDKSGLAMTNAYHKIWSQTLQKSENSQLKTDA